MSINDTVAKKDLKTKIRDFFAYVANLFHLGKKGLPEASEETLEELREVNEVYAELLKDDSFETLKKTYDNYKVGVNPDGGLIAVEKSTGYVFDEAKFVARVRFLALWRKSAFGNLDSKLEEECVSECFSEESSKIYDEIKQIIQKQLIKSGNIDTLEILNKMKESPYKWGRVVSRRLFKTQAYVETVEDFFRSITKKAKKQTKPAKSMIEALYGWGEDDLK
jgi:NurA-like 5'-3' nuclease